VFTAQTVAVMPHCESHREKNLSDKCISPQLKLDQSQRKTLFVFMYVLTALNTPF